MMHSYFFRDPEGNILNPEETSAVELYRQHNLSSERRMRHNAPGRKT